VRVDSHFFRQKLLGVFGSVGRGVVMLKQPGLFSPNFGARSSHVYTQSLQKVAVERGIHNFACLDELFVHNHLDVKESDYHALDIACHLSGLFWPWGRGVYTASHSRIQEHEQLPSLNPQVYLL
jgi:hypothetical protein